MYIDEDEHHQAHLGVSEARQAFAELVNRAAYRGERVRVMRHGKPVAAIVPIADVELLERLEDELDLQLVREALAEPENAELVPWEQVKAQLGL